MLSICIPIYNFNVNKLIKSLSNEITRLNISCEIILIDDCSDSHIKEQNKEICNTHTYIELEKNIGRANIRNLFIKYTQFENLLFLDCDSLIISNNFITNYITEIKKNRVQVICGGRIYDKVKPNFNTMLSWKYGTKQESQPVEIRKKSPHSSFMTNNFVINIDILKKIKFDERLTEYGHEDTLFGYYLKKNKIHISQINNPVLNGDIEVNKIYLEKTEKGIINLIHILKFVNYDNDFIGYVKLLSFHKIIKEKHLALVTLLIFTITKALMKYLFIKGIVNLKMFNFYKLGFLIQNSNKIEH